VKPDTSSSQDTVTGSIKPSETTAAGSVKPQAAGNQMPKIPGVRIASLDTKPLPAPDKKRWTPAVGYNPVATVAKPSARKLRKAKRPYRRRGNFGLVIGVSPRW
jgi:hypothetical protein